MGIWMEGRLGWLGRDVGISISIARPGFGWSLTESRKPTVNSALLSIRPEAAALVDAWNFSDLELQSQLGRKDGNVYEGYFQWALKEPLNKSVGGKAVFDGYQEFLKPLISGEVAERVKSGAKL